MKKYDILYIDPPWEYGGKHSDIAKIKGDCIKSLRVCDVYNTLSFEEISKIQINKIMKDNCLIFCWVVSPKLDKCIDVIKSWDNKLKFITIGFVWQKPNTILCGNYTMASTELCLIFKKGKIPTPRGARNIRQFICENRTTLNKKPDEVRNRITKMFPNQSKIELFATQRNDNWDCIGYEIDKKDIRDIIK